MFHVRISGFSVVGATAANKQLARIGVARTYIGKVGTLLCCKHGCETMLEKRAAYQWGMGRKNIVFSLE